MSSTKENTFHTQVFITSKLSEEFGNFNRTRGSNY